MVFYNDVLYACMKRVYGNEDLVGVPKYLVKQEVKVRRKLDQIKRKVIVFPLNTSLIPPPIVTIQEKRIKLNTKQHSIIKSSRISESNRASSFHGNDNESMVELLQTSWRKDESCPRKWH